MKLHLFSEEKDGPHCRTRGGIYNKAETTQDVGAVTCVRCKNPGKHPPRRGKQ
jgi:hypothetical protein